MLLGLFSGLQTCGALSVTETITGRFAIDRQVPFSYIRYMRIKYKGFIRERIRRNPVTIRPDASFFKARDYIHVMGIRHLPVVDQDHRLLGLVTDRDIRKAAPSDAASLNAYELGDLLSSLKVSDFMTPKEKLITVTPDILIEEAVQLMHQHKIGCLPVLHSEKLLGIFSETDALELLVDIFGLKQKGTRLTILLEDKPGTLFGILEVLRRHKVNVISIVLPSYVIEGNRVAAIRIRTESYEDIVKELGKAGYPVLSIGRWPSV